MAKKQKEEKVNEQNQPENVEEKKQTTAESVQDDAEQQTELTILKEQLATAEAKVNENWEKFLSAKAEADNIRKRAERDVSNAHKYALEKFIPELLTVKDSLELGAKAAKDKVAEIADEQMLSFIEGSEMAITMFADTLKKVGVEMLNPEGEVFNPDFHQAITIVPNPDVAPNTVLEVIQKGYTLNERLIRPAMVVVSKAT
ncbi:MAG: nucleotide exchange factor GrpE [Gammaproteobacteria bacterium]|nr:MAG: nucleotide exchange factor GrpE [Gammaproteobacteria bacterium]